MTLRLGVIGTGSIGQEHIDRINRSLAGASVIAMNDLDKKRVQAVAIKEKSSPRIYETGHELILAQEVDAVVVTASSPSHEEFVLASIAAGKPVFCEKPLATTSEGARRIVEAEMKHGKQLVQVGFMRRYDQGYRALKRIIDDGKIGEPLLVHCAHRNPSVSETYIGDMSITETFVHEIDVLRWLLSDDYISAQVLAPRKTRFAHEGLQDPLVVLLETKKGVRIDAEIFVACQYGYDIRCEVVGETGTASLPEQSSVVIRNEAKLSTNILTDWKLRFIDSYNLELQDWINATLNGEVQGPSSWDGYFAAVTADACIEAKRSGDIVPIAISERPAFYNKTRRN